MPDYFNNFPLPHWAIKESNGTYMEIGAQLCTKDGRYIGNAFVNKISKHLKLGLLAHIITDAGTSVTMSEKELQSRFYPPKFIMNTKKAKEKFKKKKKLNYEIII